ncbi:MAG: hypothetical protein FWG98_08525 [Candidatus Cloacimonetes bacterium]|nr:hypothetical protein [Candidatus Cloacimonadota bacterium]
MKKVLIYFFLYSLFISVFAMNLNTVDSPTAGILSRGEAMIHLKAFQNNGIVVGADVGLFDFMQFGLSAGGTNIIGNKEPDFNRVDYKIKIRIINETLTMPAIALGIDTQGHGEYYSSQRRYEIKSKGLYAVASKNASFLGLLGADFGMNYSLDEMNQKNAKHYDIFFGLYKTIGNHVTVFGDFSIGLNDLKNSKDEFTLTGLSRGYLHTAVQVHLSDQLSIKLLMHDLLENRRETDWFFDRSIMLDYRWFF